MIVNEIKEGYQPVSLKRIGLFIIPSILLLITACSGSAAEDKIYDHLEEAYELEANFEERQKELLALEKEGQELYAEIVDLEMKDMEEIKEKSQEAIDIIDQQVNEIKKEKESMDASEEAFQEAEKYIDNLDADHGKATAEDMYKVMMDRYDNYKQLYKLYNESMKRETTLYEMLSDEEVTEEDVTQQITEINEGYQEVLDASDAFNDKTKKYNALKTSFYKEANIDIKE